MTSKKAIILLSGGLDSATVLAMAQQQGYDCYALSFDYGQRHATELRNAMHIAESMQATEHKIASIDLRLFGQSALTGDLDVPKGRDIENDEIPVTYVPARNTIFLSFALAYAESIDAFDIFIGANAVDYSGYPDCRPPYIAAFENMANLATAKTVLGQGKIHIHAPLIDWEKTTIIEKGLALGVDYSLTLSCYDPTPQGQACGQCDACQIRHTAFSKHGIPDPALAKTNETS